MLNVNVLNISVSFLDNGLIRFWDKLLFTFDMRETVQPQTPSYDD